MAASTFSGTNGASRMSSPSLSRSISGMGAERDVVEEH